MRSSPSVTPEKWASFAISKLKKGYLLVINKTHRSASFYRSGKGFEPCSYKVARRLVEAGIVEEDHEQGERKYYILSREPDPPLVRHSPDLDDDDEGPEPEHGMDDILDELVETDDVADTDAVDEDDEEDV